MQLSHDITVLCCLCSQVMYARHVDQRSAVFRKALEFGERYQLRTKVYIIYELHDC